VGGLARSRHQLSTLIMDASENRAELEERIARAKANRRSGGAKYGQFFGHLFFWVPRRRVKLMRELTIRLLSRCWT
jgi:hypothetical protein